MDTQQPRKPILDIAAEHDLEQLADGGLVQGAQIETTARPCRPQPGDAIRGALVAADRRDHADRGVGDEPPQGLGGVVVEQVGIVDQDGGPVRPAAAGVGDDVVERKVRTPAALHQVRRFASPDHLALHLTEQGTLAAAGLPDDHRPDPAPQPVDDLAEFPRASDDRPRLDHRASLAAPE